MNCPFYGYAMLRLKNIVRMEYGESLTMVPSGGNQCALILDANSPCYLEIEGKPIEWKECERVAAIRLGH